MRLSLFRRSDRPGRRGKIARIISWAGAAVLGLCVVGAAAVPFSGLGWAIDLIAQFSAQFLFTTFMALAIATALRRWSQAVILAACIACHGAYLLAGRAPPSDAPPKVRLLVHNIRSQAPDAQQQLTYLEKSGADVIVLVEVDPDLVRLLRRERPLESTYPHVLMRGPWIERTSWRVVLSQWPLEDRRTRNELVCVVHAPQGAFGLVAVHPASPRDARRWHGGNDIVLGAVERARELVSEGLPVVVAGDLNSTPSGWRSRTLCDGAGLARAKPPVSYGSFPAWTPGPARLALDDAWLSGDWVVSSWRLGPSAGSDHRSIDIGLSLAR